MRRCVSPSVLLAIVTALSLRPGAAPAGVDPDALDSAETSVCVAKTRLDGALAGAAEARRSSVPVEELTGERIDDPTERAALQGSLDGMIVSAQDGLVVSFREEFTRAQAEHRRLTGSTFNTARCNGAEIRMSHRQAADREREAQANANFARAMAQHEAGERAYQEQMQVDAACTDQEVLSLPADVAARLFPPGYVNETRARHAEFTRSYQQRTGKRFDPATLCP